MMDANDIKLTVSFPVRLYDKKYLAEKLHTGNSRLSRAMEGRKVTDNSKQRLKQMQSKYYTKRI
jgi:hypothetical protein